MSGLIESKLFRIMFGSLLLALAYWMSDNERNEFAVYLLAGVGGFLVISVVFTIVQNFGNGKKPGSRSRKKR